VVPKKGDKSYEGVGAKADHAIRGLLGPKVGPFVHRLRRELSPNFDPWEASRLSCTELEVN
jgi:hypothetical protein